MIRKLLPWLVIAALAAVAFGLIYEGPPLNIAGEASLEDTTEAGTADPLAAEGGQRTGDPKSGGPGTSVAASGDSKREAVEASHQVKRVRTMRVRVFEKSGGEPVPGAVIRYMSPEFHWEQMSPAEQLAWGRLQFDSEKRYETYGGRLVADSKGWADVPVGPSGCQCCGRSGELFGQATFAANLVEPAGGHRLELEPDISVTIQVVDDQAKPVIGAPVVIRIGYSWGGPSNVYYQNHPVGETKAPKGLLTIRHLQCLKSQWGIRAGTKNKGPLLGLDVAGSGDTGQQLDIENPPEETVVLVMPRAGSLRFILKDLAGKLVDDPGTHVRLQLVDPTKKSTNNPFGYYQPDNTAYKILVNGEAVFPFVAIGKTFKLSSSARNESVSKTIAGPLRPGQRTETELRLTNKSYLVLGRAVDVDGEPMANIQISGSASGVDKKKRVRASASARTNAKGEFRLYLSSRVKGRNMGPLNLRASNPQNNRRLGTATSNPLGVLPVGSCKIGEVVFVQLPLIVSGFAVDDEGLPVKVRGYVQKLVEQSGKAEPRFVDSVTVRSEADGHFEVRGKLVGTRGRLNLKAAEYIALDPFEFVPGTKDLRVEFQKGGKARVEIHFDKGIRSRDIEVQLVSSVTAAEASASRKSGPPGWTEKGVRARLVQSKDQNFVYQWQGLSPGTYDLEIRAKLDSTLLQAPVSLSISAAEIQRYDLDLSGALRCIEITVLDPAGKKLSRSTGGGIFIRPTVPGGTFEGVSVRSGLAKFVTSRQFVNLLVAMSGYRLQTVDGVSENSQIRLVDGITVELRLADGGKGLPKGMRLRLSVSPIAPKTAVSQPYQLKGRSVRRSRTGGKGLDGLTQSRSSTYMKEGRTTFKTGSGGRFQISASLRSSTRTRSSPRSMTVTTDPKFVEVLDAGNQSFVLTLDPASLKAAIAKLTPGKTAATKK